MNKNTTLKTRLTAVSINWVLMGEGDQHSEVVGDSWSDGFFTAEQNGTVRVQAIFADAIDLLDALKRWRKALRNEGLTVIQTEDALYCWESK